MMEWFHLPHPAQENVAAGTGPLLGQPYFCIPWINVGETQIGRWKAVHTTQKVLGNLPAPDWLSPFASIFWGTPTRRGAPSRGELVPKASERAKVLLNCSCTVSALESVRDYVLKDGRVIVFRGGDPCCTEDSVSHCNHKYLWLQLHFPPKTYIIFWLFLLLIDLPLSTGCQEMPQTIEFITVHCAPILHHSALPSSSVPDIFSYPAAKNLARREFQSHLCPQGLSLSATHL